MTAWRWLPEKRLTGQSVGGGRQDVMPDDRLFTVAFEELVAGLAGVYRNTQPWRSRTADNAGPAPAEPGQGKALTGTALDGDIFIVTDIEHVPASGRQAISKSADCVSIAHRSGNSDFARSRHANSARI
jgi:hypothetical protein